MKHGTSVISDQFIEQYERRAGAAVGAAVGAALAAIPYIDQQARKVILVADVVFR